MACGNPFVHTLDSLSILAKLICIVVLYICTIPNYICNPVYVSPMCNYVYFINVHLKWISVRNLSVSRKSSELINVKFNQETVLLYRKCGGEGVVR